MTDKRFNYHHDGFGAYYLCDKEKGTYEDSIMGEIWADKSDMTDLVDLLNNLHDENNKIKSILLNKVEELNNAYNKSARAGMPTGGIVGELYTLQEICIEMGWIE